MVLIGVVAVLLAVWAVWAARPVAAEPAPVPDPHEGEVRAFRRDLYDWLRGG